MKYTVKHILNKNLKSIEDPKNSDIQLFPVYGQLIFRRKNYMFKSIIKSYYTDLKYVSGDDTKLMTFEIEFLKNIIEFEIKIKGEKFNVAGFAEKYEKYRRSVIAEAERLLIGKIESLLRFMKSKFQDSFDYSYSPEKFKHLLEAVRTIIPDITERKEFRKCELAQLFWNEYNKTYPRKNQFGLVFPTVYDWFEGLHRDAMENIFKYREIDCIDLLLEYLHEFDFQMKSQIAIV